MGRATSNPNYMNGVPELLILRLLAEREMYGYELVRAIRESTREAIRLGEGIVYPVLHALEAQSALACRRVEVNGRRRVYYRITAKGRRRMTRNHSDWSRIARAIEGVFRNPDDARATT